MDNNELKMEAKRIADQLIKIQKSDCDLDTLVDKLINKKFKANSLNIIFYLTDILAEKKYYINEVAPFEVKKYNS